MRIMYGTQSKLYVPVFESKENTIFVLSQNCFCSLNLVFSMFSVLSLFILTTKQFSKTVNHKQIGPIMHASM